MRPCVVLVSLSLVACGGGGAAASPGERERASSGGECEARGQLAAAEDALGTCRAVHASDPGWPARGAYDALLPRLSSHLTSLDPPRVVTADEVQPLAEQAWELLDQIEFPPGAESARGRVEAAVERLLRDRDVESAPGAAIEALDAVTQLGTAVDPTGGVDPCAGESLAATEARVAADACE